MSLATIDTRASDWFADDAAFKRVCFDAMSNCRTQAAQEFTHDMMRKANEEGVRVHVSEKQVAWLCALAQVPVPPRRKERPR